MDTVRTVIKQIEPWYLFMVLVGAFNVGFNIMLIPQHLAANFTNGLALIGIVMAAWTAGPLVGPLLSPYIDKWGKPKHWLASLLLANGVLALLIPYCTSIPLIFLNLLLQGLVYAIAYSILNLLIVRRFSEEEWHGRTGMLIAAFIIGEVIGFGIAGHINNPVRGIVGGGIVLLCSSVLALVMVPNFKQQPVLTYEQQKQKHDLGKLINSPFGIMALGWGLLCFSAQIIFLPFPVLMREVFQLDPTLSSSVVSASGIIALSFYPIVGKLTAKFGADNILIISSAVKTCVFLVLGLSALQLFPALTSIVLGMLFLNRCTWPFMMASSQIQAAQLSTGSSKSMALVVFMAVAGFGNMMSGVMNSVITANWGMQYVPIVAAITACCGVLLLVGNKYRGTNFNQFIDIQQKHYP